MSSAFVYIPPPPGEVIGTAGDDRLSSGKAADRVDGLGGIDTFIASAYYPSLHRESDSGGNMVWMVGADTLVNIEYVEFYDLRVRLDDPVHLQPTQHAHTPGADVLIGNDLAYALAGGDGDDMFTGHGGDDALYGGKGHDTAVYRGKRADYALSVDTVSQWVYVNDQTAGRDGQDTLSSIETLRFADGDVAVSSLLAAVPAGPALAALPAPTADQTSPDHGEGVWKVVVTSAKYEFGSTIWEVKTDREWVSSSAPAVMYVALGTAAGVPPASSDAADSFDLVIDMAIDMATDQFVDLVGLADRQPWMFSSGFMEP